MTDKRTSYHAPTFEVRIAVLLGDEPDLSARAIARRVGCSHTAAWLWKKRIATEVHNDTSDTQDLGGSALSIGDVVTVASVGRRRSEKTYNAGFTVYRIINRVNGKLYIGSTTKKLSKRWEQHRNAVHQLKEAGKPLYQDMLHYGIEHFTIEPVTECATKFEMRSLETRLILQQNTIWPHGYNLDTGRIREEAI